ncbi:toll-like receptor 2 [Mercenaria mercenaria]|uniref:toll-like receptor 2 n=1 Tax=Mercenaria mercenaria TaxID=6596 RepID=UPI00234E96C6|nr:toll-like receptor 2 [Mercenaria mercenaria]
MRSVAETINFEGEIWKNVKVLRIDEIGRIDPYKLIGLTNLEELTLISNNVEIDKGSFAGLDNLKLLCIKGVTILSPYAFSSLTTLEELYLLSNQPMVIHKDSFAGFHHLKSSLVDELKRIHPSILTKLSILHGMIPGGSRSIGIHLYNGSFTGLNRLKVLEIYELREIKPNAFSGLSNLEQLKLHEMPIVKLYNGSFEGLGRLKSLAINNIYSIHSDAFANLKNLQQMNLSVFSSFEIHNETFVGLDHLNSLQMDGLNKIPPYFFLGLQNLRQLTIIVKQSMLLFDNSFTYLDNLKDLHFSASYSGSILAEDIATALPTSDKTILPTLEAFSLTNLTLMGTSYSFEGYESLKKTRIFLDALFSKPLTSLNLHQINVPKYFLVDALCYAGRTNDHLKAFNSVRSINVNMHVVHIENINDNSPFPFSGTNIAFKLQRTATTLQLELPLVVSSSGVLNVTGIYTTYKEVDIKNLTVNLRTHCKGHCIITNIIIRNLGLRYLDAIFLCNESMLEKLDLSSNVIEFFHPKLCTCCSHLLEMNLCNNQLFKMAARNGSLFEQLITFYENLETLHLSSNQLSSIPREMFTSNKRLKFIDLSTNLLVDISFKIRHLVNLKVLNLQNNRIAILDQESFVNLKSLTAKNKFVVFSLDDNPFTCSTCDNLASVKWLATAPSIDRFGRTFVCTSPRGNIIPFDRNAVNQLQEECDKQTWIRNIVILSTLIPLTIAALTAISVRVYLKYRQRKLKWKNMQNSIELIRLDQLKTKFLVFLSYSSNDCNFAKEYVYDPLNLHLQQKIGIERGMVCLGDRHFQLGKPINDEMVLCLQQSAVVLLLLSRNFCDSEYCRMEFDHALRMNKPIILMVKDEVNVNEMVPSLQELYKVNTRLLWERNGDIYEIKTSWDNVCDSILELVPWKNE